MRFPLVRDIIIVFVDRTELEIPLVSIYVAECLEYIALFMYLWFQTLINIIKHPLAAVSYNFGKMK